MIRAESLTALFARLSQHHSPFQSTLFAAISVWKTEIELATREASTISLLNQGHRPDPAALSSLSERDLACLYEMCFSYSMSMDFKLSPLSIPSTRSHKYQEALKNLDASESSLTPFREVFSLDSMINASQSDAVDRWFATATSAVKWPDRASRWAVATIALTKYIRASPKPSQPIPIWMAIRVFIRLTVQHGTLWMSGMGFDVASPESASRMLNTFVQRMIELTIDQYRSWMPTGLPVPATEVMLLAAWSDVLNTRTVDLDVRTRLVSWIGSAILSSEPSTVFSTLNAMTNEYATLSADLYQLVLALAGSGLDWGEDLIESWRKWWEFCVGAAGQPLLSTVRLSQFASAPLSNPIVPLPSPPPSTIPTPPVDNHDPSYKSMTDFISDLVVISELGRMYASLSRAHETAESLSQFENGNDMVQAIARLFDILISDIVAWLGTDATSSLQSTFVRDLVHPSNNSVDPSYLTELVTAAFVPTAINSIIQEISSKQYSAIHTEQIKPDALDEVRNVLSQWTLILLAEQDRKWISMATGLLWSIVGIEDSITMESGTSEANVALWTESAVESRRRRAKLMIASHDSPGARSVGLVWVLVAMMRVSIETFLVTKDAQADDPNAIGASALDAWSELTSGKLLSNTHPLAISLAYIPVCVTFLLPSITLTLVEPAIEERASEEIEAPSNNGRTRLAYRLIVHRNNVALSRRRVLTMMHTRLRADRNSTVWSTTVKIWALVLTWIDSTQMKVAWHHTDQRRILTSLLMDYRNQSSSEQQSATSRILAILSVPLQPTVSSQSVAEVNASLAAIDSSVAVTSVDRIRTLRHVAEFVSLLTTSTSPIDHFPDCLTQLLSTLLDAAFLEKMVQWQNTVKTRDLPGVLPAQRVIALAWTQRVLSTLSMGDNPMNLALQNACTDLLETSTTRAEENSPDAEYESRQSQPGDNQNLGTLSLPEIADQRDIWNTMEIVPIVEHTRAFKLSVLFQKLFDSTDFSVDLQLEEMYQRHVHAVQTRLETVTAPFDQDEEETRTIATAGMEEVHDREEDGEEVSRIVEQWKVNIDRYVQRIIQPLSHQQASNIVQDFGCIFGKDTSCTTILVDPAQRRTLQSAAAANGRLPVLLALIGIATSRELAATRPPSSSRGSNTVVALETLTKSLIETTYTTAMTHLIRIVVLSRDATITNTVASIFSARASTALLTPRALFDQLQNKAQASQLGDKPTCGLVYSVADCEVGLDIYSQWEVDVVWYKSRLWIPALVVWGKFVTACEQSDLHRAIKQRSAARSLRLLESKSAAARRAMNSGGASRTELRTAFEPDFEASYVYQGAFHERHVPVSKQTRPHIRLVWGDRSVFGFADALLLTSRFSDVCLSLLFASRETLRSLSDPLKSTPWVEDEWRSVASVWWSRYTNPMEVWKLVISWSAYIPFRELILSPVSGRPPPNVAKLNKVDVSTEEVESEEEEEGGKRPTGKAAIEEEEELKEPEALSEDEIRSLLKAEQESASSQPRGYPIIRLHARRVLGYSFDSLHGLPSAFQISRLIFDENMLSRSIVAVWMDRERERVRMLRHYSHQSEPECVAHEQWIVSTQAWIDEKWGTDNSGRLYRHPIHRVMWIDFCIAHAAGQLTEFMSQLSECHQRAAGHWLRFIRSASDDWRVLCSTRAYNAFRDKELQAARIVPRPDIAAAERSAVQLPDVEVLIQSLAKTRADWGTVVAEDDSIQSHPFVDGQTAWVVWLCRQLRLHDRWARSVPWQWLRVIAFGNTPEKVTDGIRFLLDRFGEDETDESNTSRPYFVRQTVELCHDYTPVQCMSRHLASWSDEHDACKRIQNSVIYMSRSVDVRKTRTPVDILASALTDAIDNDRSWGVVYMTWLYHVTDWGQPTSTDDDLAALFTADADDRGLVSQIIHASTLSTDEISEGELTQWLAAIHHLFRIRVPALDATIKRSANDAGVDYNRARIMEIIAITSPISATAAAGMTTQSWKRKVLEIESRKLTPGSLIHRDLLAVRTSEFILDFIVRPPSGSRSVHPPDTARIDAWVSDWNRRKEAFVAWVADNDVWKSRIRAGEDSGFPHRWIVAVEAIQNEQHEQATDLRHRLTFKDGWALSQIGCLQSFIEMYVRYCGMGRDTRRIIDSAIRDDSKSMAPTRPPLEPMASATDKDSWNSWITVWMKNHNLSWPRHMSWSNILTLVDISRPWKTVADTNWLLRWVRAMQSSQIVPEASLDTMTSNTIWISTVKWITTREEWTDSDEPYEDSDDDADDEDVKPKPHDEKEACASDTRKSALESIRTKRSLAASLKEPEPLSVTGRSRLKKIRIDDDELMLTSADTSIMQTGMDTDVVDAKNPAASVSAVESPVPLSTTTNAPTAPPRPMLGVLGSRPATTTGAAPPLATKRKITPRLIEPPSNLSLLTQTPSQSTQPVPTIDDVNKTTDLVWKILTANPPDMQLLAQIDPSIVDQAGDRRPISQALTDAIANAHVNGGPGQQSALIAGSSANGSGLAAKLTRILLSISPHLNMTTVQISVMSLLQRLSPDSPDLVMQSDVFGLTRDDFERLEKARSGLRAVSKPDTWTQTQWHSILTQTTLDAVRNRQAWSATHKSASQWTVPQLRLMTQLVLYKDGFPTALRLLLMTLIFFPADSDAWSYALASLKETASVNNDAMKSIRDLGLFMSQLSSSPQLKWYENEVSLWWNVSRIDGILRQFLFPPVVEALLAGRAISSADAQLTDPSARSASEAYAISLQHYYIGDSWGRIVDLLTCLERRCGTEADCYQAYIDVKSQLSRLNVTIRPHNTVLADRTQARLDIRPDWWFSSGNPIHITDSDSKQVVLSINTVAGPPTLVEAICNRRLTETERDHIMARGQACYRIAWMDKARHAGLIHAQTLLGGNVLPPDFLLSERPDTSVESKTIAIRTKHWSWDASARMYSFVGSAQDGTVVRIGLPGPRNRTDSSHTRTIVNERIYPLVARVGSRLWSKYGILCYPRNHVFSPLVHLSWGTMLILAAEGDVAAKLEIEEKMLGLEAANPCGSTMSACDLYDVLMTIRARVNPGPATARPLWQQRLAVYMPDSVYRDCVNTDFVSLTEITSAMSLSWIHPRTEQDNAQAEAEWVRGVTGVSIDMFSEGKTGKKCNSLTWSNDSVLIDGFDLLGSSIVCGSWVGQGSISTYHVPVTLAFKNAPAFSDSRHSIQQSVVRGPNAFTTFAITGSDTTASAYTDATYEFTLITLRIEAVDDKPRSATVSGLNVTWFIPDTQQNLTVEKFSTSATSERALLKLNLLYLKSNIMKYIIDHAQDARPLDKTTRFAFPQLSVRVSAPADREWKSWTQPMYTSESGPGTDMSNHPGMHKPGLGASSVFRNGAVNMDGMMLHTASIDKSMSMPVNELLHVSPFSLSTFGVNCPAAVQSSVPTGIPTNDKIVIANIPHSVIIWEPDTKCPLLIVNVMHA